MEIAPNENSPIEKENKKEITIIILCYHGSNWQIKGEIYKDSK